ncbi:hypothetical protein [Phenylobacterium sp.]|uniref:hypothetical protein n=1 Tax=Phenylobacterium sp. TaxID=1871053 RepID=UPI00260BBC68|nr:hypothetical protein [Phenylobacterium sp.]
MNWWTGAWRSPARRPRRKRQAAHLELAALWTRLAGEADPQAQAPVLEAADEPRAFAETVAGAEGGPASRA